MQTLTVETGKQQAKAYSGVTDFMTQNAHKAALACRFKAGNPISCLLYSYGFTMIGYYSMISRKLRTFNRGGRSASGRYA